MDKIKVGDLVELKSGGPKMTVRNVDDGNKAALIIVCYFTKNHTLKVDRFPPETLIKVSADK